MLLTSHEQRTGQAAKARRLSAPPPACDTSTRECRLSWPSIRCSRSRRPRNPPRARLAQAGRWRILRPAHFFIVTSVMPFTRLLASMKLPSRVTDVLRTMFPPPGIAQLWNFAVLGSKRTTVFGVDPDSLYQMMSLIAEMPYGSDFGPLGDGHSVTLPDAGSRRPRYPREKSEYQTVSSVVIVIRRGLDPGSGRGYSRISSVFGSILPTLLVPNAT